MKNEFTNGRRKGCGACGASESNEYLQLDSTKFIDCKHEPIPGQVLPKGNDFQEVPQPDNLLVIFER